MSYIVLTNIYTILGVMNGIIVIAYRVISYSNGMYTHIKVK